MFKARWKGRADEIQGQVAIWKNKNEIAGKNGRCLEGDAKSNEYLVIGCIQSKGQTLPNIAFRCTGFAGMKRVIFLGGKQFFLNKAIPVIGC